MCKKDVPREEKTPQSRASCRIPIIASGHHQLSSHNENKDDYREEGRQDAAHSSEIEVLRRKSVGREFSEENSSNEIAGDDEEISTPRNPPGNHEELR